MMDLVNELVAQWEVFLLGYAGKINLLLIRRPRYGVGGGGGEPYWQYLGLQSNLGGDAEQQLYYVGLDVFTEGNRADGTADKVHQRNGEYVILEEVLLFTIDKGVVQLHGVTDHALVVGGGCDLGDGGVYLLGGGEAEAQVGGGQSRFVLEHLGEALEATANVDQGVAVAGQRL